jgi:protein SCO1/2
MRRTSSLKRLITIIAAVAALGGGYYIGNLNKGLVKPKPQIATLFENGRPLKPFSMQTASDNEFNNEDLLGKWSFLYFGYTFCPDICPTTLMQFVLMTNRLSADKELLDKSQFVMFSVDPDRDSPEKLEAYMKHFHPDFIGATGSREAIDSITQDLGIYYKLHEPDENGHYPVDHTSAVILVDPEGNLAAIYSAINDPKVAASDFQLIAGQAE